MLSRRKLCFVYFSPESCAVCLATQSSNSATPWTVACQAPLSMVILQARILEWVAMPSSRGSPQPRDRTQIFHIEGGFFTVWATREVLSNTKFSWVDAEFYIMMWFP